MLRIILSTITAIVLVGLVTLLIHPNANIVPQSVLLWTVVILFVAALFCIFVPVVNAFVAPLWRDFVGIICILVFGFGTYLLLSPNGKEAAQKEKSAIEERVEEEADDSPTASTDEPDDDAAEKRKQRLEKKL